MQGCSMYKRPAPLEGTVTAESLGFGAVLREDVMRCPKAAYSPRPMVSRANATRLELIVNGGALRGPTVSALCRVAPIVPASGAGN